MPNPLKYAILGLNTAGLAAYLVWVALAGKSRLLYSKEGVLYLLPCLPFFFVFFYFMKEREKPAGGDPSKAGEKGEEQDATDKLLKRFEKTE